MNEQTVLTTALEALERNTDIKAIELEPRAGRAGTRLKLEGADYLVEVKANVLRTNIGAIINRLKGRERDENPLLVGRYINDNLGEVLREANINYLDTVGNAYIQKKPFFVFIKGNAAPKDKTPQIGQAFTPTGLKVVFALIVQPDLVTHGTQREIAKQADVALGAVGKIITDLVKKGFLYERLKTNDRYWNKDQVWQLIDKWVDAYPKLRHKQFIGWYTTPDAQWWKTQQLNLEQYDAFLGGEIAAEQTTHFLKPEVGTIYLNADKANKLLNDLRWAKAKPDITTGTRIELLAKFWPTELADQNRLTHPLVTYADLITTGDVRNIETAQIIRDKHLTKMVEGLARAR